MPHCKSCHYANREAVKPINEWLLETFGDTKGAYCICMRDNERTGLIFSPYATFPCPPERAGVLIGLEKFVG